MAPGLCSMNCPDRQLRRRQQQRFSPLLVPLHGTSTPQQPAKLQREGSDPALQVPVGPVQRQEVLAHTGRVVRVGSQPLRADVLPTAQHAGLLALGTVSPLMRLQVLGPERSAPAVAAADLPLRAGELHVVSPGLGLDLLLAARAGQRAVLALVLAVLCQARRHQPLRGAVGAGRGPPGTAALGAEVLLEPRQREDGVAAFPGAEHLRSRRRSFVRLGECVCVCVLSVCVCLCLCICLFWSVNLFAIMKSRE